MPARPPARWFRRCTEAVSAHGGAVDPAAVCGANWQRKAEGEKRALVRSEEGRAVKKKSKKTKPRKKKMSAKKRARHLAARQAADTREFMARMKRLERS